MAIGIDDLYDDDDEIIEGQQPSNYQLEPDHSEENDILSDFLKTKGIDNLEKIKFEDENNNIIERNWNDLSREEKFNILDTHLVTPQNNEENALSDQEISLINNIRQSQMTPQQYLAQLQGEPIEPTYKVDDLSDDELYILDLESRVGDLTDEEAAEALNNAKQNEIFYKKQIEGIRKEYENREDYQNQQELAKVEEEREQAYRVYQDNIIDSINQFNAIGNLDLNLEDADKEELAEFMLATNDSGENYLYQALQDPQTLTKAAWFILNGEDAFNSISDYFTNQIKLISENQYRKGFEDGKKGESSKPSVVIQKNNKNSNHRSYNSINDLDDDD